MESKYSNLAELRGDLTADNPDVRAKAYQAVLEADVQPSAVLGQDPPEDVLTDAGVIPASRASQGRPAADLREEQVEVLKEIRDLLAETGGSA